MNPRDALDLTIRLYKINATRLAERAGLHKSELSRYRNKKQDLYGDSVVSIMQALPADAYKFFTELLRNESGQVTVKVVEC
jgi:hypothetical protein